MSDGSLGFCRKEAAIGGVNDKANKKGTCMIRILLCGLACVFAFSAFGQGTFQNLNFEQARITPTPTNEYGGGVDPALAFPGWTLSQIDSGYPLFVLYKNLTLDAPAIDLLGPAFPNALGIESLQGSYSAILQHSAFFKFHLFLARRELFRLMQRQSILLSLCSRNSP